MRHEDNSAKYAIGRVFIIFEDIKQNCISESTGSMGDSENEAHVGKRPSFGGRSASSRLGSCEAEIVVVDGEIGAGKTTFMKVLAEHFRSIGKQVCVIFEPVEVWEKVGILKKFYADKDRYCYEFQTYIVVTRLKRILESYREAPDADIYLIERSPFTDRHVFVEMLSDAMDDTQKIMYRDWWNVWLELMPFQINKYLYLKPDIDECMRRIEERHRVGEIDQDKNKKQGVTKEYQHALRKQHEKYYDQIRDQKIILDGAFSNGDFRIPGANQARILDRAEKFILGHL